LVHGKGSNIIGFEQINFIRRKQYCNKCEPTQISHLTIFNECFRGPLKMLWTVTFDTRAANCPPLMYSIYTLQENQFQH